MNHYFQQHSARDSLLSVTIHLFFRVMIHISVEQEVDGKHHFDTRANEGIECFSSDAYSAEFKIKGYGVFLHET